MTDNTELYARAERAERNAAMWACHLEDYLKQWGIDRISMTKATEAIWGTSGRGNPNAVRIIEATATLGYLRIKRHGRRYRFVSRTNKPIPDDARAEYAARNFGDHNS